MACPMTRALVGLAGSPAPPPEDCIVRSEQVNIVRSEQVKLAQLIPAQAGTGSSWLSGRDSVVPER